MPFLLAQIAPESFLIGGWQAERVQPPPVLPVRVAASSSTNAVSFSSARTMKRFPSPPCASAMQIVRPRESNGGHVAQRQPAFLNCLRLFPHRSCAAPAHTHGIAIDSTGAHGDAYSISNHLRNSRVTCGRLRNACIRARSGPSIDASS
jgi:hypothetical protein